MAGFKTGQAQPADPGDHPGPQDGRVVLDRRVLPGNGEALNPLLQILGKPPGPGSAHVPWESRVVTSAMAVWAAFLVGKPRCFFCRRCPSGPGARSTMKYQVPRASSRFTVPPTNYITAIS